MRFRVCCGRTTIPATVPICTPRTCKAPTAARCLCPAHRRSIGKTSPWAPARCHSCCNRGRDSTPRPASISAIRETTSRHGRSSRCMRSPSRSRSEEHTSELQSRRDLVCRLLLEKKKKTKKKNQQEQKKKKIK